jgi:hypothetical protein
VSIRVLLVDDEVLVSWGFAPSLSMPTTSRWWVRRRTAPTPCGLWQQASEMVSPAVTRRHEAGLLEAKRIE